MHWTTEQILELADTGTATRAKGLAKVTKWVSLSSNGKAAWGLCKGSGKNPYQTAVDFNGPAFKCSCPSRKFPCKHAVALLLLASSDTDGFHITEEIPDWVNTWLTKRQAKATPKETTKEATEEDLQKAAERKAKTLEARMKLMRSGIDDLELWLLDIIRMGLASTDGSAMDMATSYQRFSRSSSSLPWENIAQRMVDAKLGGLGRRLRELSQAKDAEENWHESALENLSDIYLIIQGFKKIEQLPPAYQQQILSLCGVNTSKDEVLSKAPIIDNWMVVHQQETENIDQAKVRRTWFLGQETGRFALSIEFDYRRMGFMTQWSVGRIYKGSMHFYPNLFPLRAILEQAQVLEHAVDGWGEQESCEAFLEEYSQAMGKSPWILNYPVAFTGVVPYAKDNQFYIVDSEGKALPLSDNSLTNWRIISLSGSQPVDIFGEWNGQEFTPLSVVANYHFVVMN